MSQPGFWNSSPSGKLIAFHQPNPILIAEVNPKQLEGRFTLSPSLFEGLHVMMQCFQPQELLRRLFLDLLDRTKDAVVALNQA